MASNLPMSPQLEQIHGEIRDHFRALAYVLHVILLFNFLTISVVVTKHCDIYFRVLEFFDYVCSIGFMRVLLNADDKN